MDSIWAVRGRILPEEKKRTWRIFQPDGPVHRRRSKPCSLPLNRHGMRTLDGRLRGGGAAGGNGRDPGGGGASMAAALPAEPTTPRPPDLASHAELVACAGARLRGGLRFNGLHPAGDLNLADGAGA